MLSGSAPPLHVHNSADLEEHIQLVLGTETSQSYRNSQEQNSDSQWIHESFTAPLTIFPVLTDYLYPLALVCVLFPTLTSVLLKQECLVPKLSNLVQHLSDCANLKENLQNIHIPAIPHILKNYYNWVRYPIQTVSSNITWHYCYFSILQIYIRYFIDCICTLYLSFKCYIRVIFIFIFIFQNKI